jgi:hypothetical protein
VKGALWDPSQGGGAIGDISSAGGETWDGHEVILPRGADPTKHAPCAFTAMRSVLGVEEADQAPRGGIGENPGRRVRAPLRLGSWTERGAFACATDAAGLGPSAREFGHGADVVDEAGDKVAVDLCVRIAVPGRAGWAPETLSPAGEAPFASGLHLKQPHEHQLVGFEDAS